MKDTELWQNRIEAARNRRDAHTERWKQYSKLHNAAIKAVESGDIYADSVTLDQVNLALVFRNIEQTLGYLEFDDIGITATATDYKRELDNIDTVRESIVEQALYSSLKNSGLITKSHRLDRIKLDALIVGHGVSFTWWNVIKEKQEISRQPILVEGEDGYYAHKKNDDGSLAYKKIMDDVVIWEGVVDERISPLEFLCSATCSSIDESSWLGFEKIMHIDDVRSNPRFAGLPKNIKGSTFEISNLYEDIGTATDASYSEDSLKVITIWDRKTRKLLTFVDNSGTTKNRRQRRKNGKAKKDEFSFIKLSEVDSPVQFANFQDSPFTIYIPMPSSDNPFGISQVEHTRNPALTGDIMYSRFANMSREQKRLWLYDKNKVTSTQVTDALDSKTNLAALGLDIQDGDDISRIFKDIQNTNIPDSLLDSASLSEDMVRKNSGVSEMPFGGTETATESENQMMIGQARVNRKRNKLFNYLETVSQVHLAYLRSFAASGSQIRISLADGTEQIVEYGRESFQGLFNLKVEPSGGASAVSPVRQKMLIEAVGLVSASMGAKASLLLYREVLTQLDVRNVNSILQAAKQFMIPQEEAMINQQGGLPASPPAPVQQLPDLTSVGAATDGNVIGNAVNITR